MSASIQTKLIRVTDLCRNVLMQGRNLDTVIRYAGKSPVNVVRIDYSVDRPNSYAVTFYFDDGCQCVTHWADVTVLMDWIAARRSWGLDYIRCTDDRIYEKCAGTMAARVIRDKGTLLLSMVGSKKHAWAA